jgi:purine-binding chemotaxis protein CheW
MIDEEDNNGPLVRWITCRLGGESYGIEVKQVREILRINNVLPVPGAPDCVVGITNIRGNVVTVIDGRRRLNLPAQELTDAARMIVLESSDEVAAIIVDSVSDVMDMPVSAIDASPKLNSREDAHYISGVISNDSSLIIILNVDRFISDQQCDMAVGF